MVTVSYWYSPDMRTIVRVLLLVRRAAEVVVVQTLKAKFDENTIGSKQFPRDQLHHHQK